LLNPGDIPVIPVDRGGQVTYHGPGQLVMYTLFDLNRLGIGVQQLVQKIEQAVINLLADYEIEAHGRRDAPGVYVGDAKIAALGLRIKRGKSYHGLSFNVDMDLEPFSRINPCGYVGMPVTQFTELKPGENTSTLSRDLTKNLTAVLGYNNVQF
jgi:lipoyl(octanoyl) transferase